MNAGALQLSALGLSLAQMVEQLETCGLKADRPMVSRWRGGKRLPDEQARPFIEKAFGIPARAWDDPPTSEPEKPSRAEIPKPIVAPPATPPDSTLDPTAAELAKDLLGRIQALREQSEMTTLPLSARKALADMEGKAIERYAKLSGQASSEREILSSPHFTRVVDRVMVALERFPDALRAVRDALQRAEEAEA